MGYSRAGFDVVGIDINPQPRYPFEFHQADWRDYLERHWREFDVIHASPPCQGYSRTQNLSKSESPLLISEVRAALQATGRFYVIENVVGASRSMLHPVKLRGNMFGLQTVRDRLFEVSPMLLSNPPQPIEGTTHSKKGYSKGDDLICVAGNMFNLADGKKALGIDWMNCKELAQAIPPAYTQWIGEQLITILQREREYAEA